MSRPRVILLGASNLTRMLPTMLLMLPGALGASAVDVIAAIGRGRSYGTRSRLLGRTLEGIVECGLWDAINAGDRRAPAFALITDIGNDIMYGQPLGTIVEWVETCAVRLARHGARLVITPPPMASIERLTPSRYRFVKRLFFPNQPITFDEAIGKARLLDEMVRDLARRRGATLVEHDRAWYGFDPIHVGSRRFHDACARLLRPWMTEAPGVPGAPETSAAGAISRGGAVEVGRMAAAVTLARPLRWERFGRVFITPQPALRLPGGSLVWLY